MLYIYISVRRIGLVVEQLERLQSFSYAENAIAYLIIPVFSSQKNGSNSCKHYESRIIYISNIIVLKSIKSVGFSHESKSSYEHSFENICCRVIFFNKICALEIT